MRFGWEHAVLKYTINKTTPLHSPQTFPKAPQPKIPDFKTAKFGFDTEEFVLLHIPVLDVDITTSVDQIMQTAYTQGALQLKKAWESLGKQYNAKKSGFYGVSSQKGKTPQEGTDYIIIKALGQQEKIEHDTGKEKIIFHDYWFKGEYTLGISGNLSNIGGSFFTMLNNFDYKLNAKGDGVSLHKGSFYGAVKYNDTWKIARIIKE
jgi:hypothetical protein